MWPEGQDAEPHGCGPPLPPGKEKIPSSKSLASSLFAHAESSCLYLFTKSYYSLRSVAVLSLSVQTPIYGLLSCLRLSYLSLLAALFVDASDIDFAWMAHFLYILLSIRLLVLSTHLVRLSLVYTHSSYLVSVSNLPWVW